MWSKMNLQTNRANQLYVLVLLQILFLAAIVILYYAVDWTGKEIRLKTAPLDPSDLFYGDYVVLNYDISRLPSSLWQGDKKVERGDAVYVLLKPGSDGLYQVVAIYPRRPDAAGQEVVLKGKVDNSFSDDEIFIKYGLERYYVQQGTGTELEKKRKDMVVHVKIAPWGQAKISGLEY